MSPGPESTEFTFDLVVCPLPGRSKMMLCDVFSFNKYINSLIQGYLHSSLIVIVLYLAASSDWTALLATDQKISFLFPLKNQRETNTEGFQTLGCGPLLEQSKIRLMFAELLDRIDFLPRFVWVELSYKL